MTEPRRGDLSLSETLARGFHPWDPRLPVDALREASERLQRAEVAAHDAELALRAQRRVHDDALVERTMAQAAFDSVRRSSEENR